jgi:hypothetical protein
MTALATSLTGVDVDLTFATGGDGDIQTLMAPPENPNQWIKVFRVLLTVTLPDNVPFTTLLFYSNTNRLAGGIQLLHGGAIVLGLEQRRWYMARRGQALNLRMSTPGRVVGGLTVEVSDT